MKFNMAANRPRTQGESLRSANKDVGRRARKDTTDLPRRMLDRAVRHDSNSTFNTYEDLDLAESDRMMSKRRPASTKISILEKTLTTQPTDAAAARTDGSASRKAAQLEEWSQMMIEKIREEAHTDHFAKSLPTTTGCPPINIEVIDLFRLKRFPVLVRPESRHFVGLTQAETAVTDILEAKRKLREGEMRGKGGKSASQGPSLFNGL
ncbi:hypothetical protein B0H13DRAFT_2261057 [Mycena leptocephala]|nr:hypothetical protein B0H13DRAFT_2261057 [Mycena leptocephala]